MALTLGTIVLVLIFLAPPTGAQYEEAEYGGVMRYAVKMGYERETLDPVRNYPMMHTMSPVYERLCCIDQKTMKLLPELATDWSTLDGGVTWVVHLIDNATWHDGVKFTSEDVKFTCLWLSNRSSPSLPFIPPYGGVAYAKYVESIETPDDYTVIFHCKLPTVFYNLCETYIADGFIYPKHIWYGVPLDESSGNTHPIGTGPFKFVKWAKHDYFLFEKYEDYWREGRPFLDKWMTKFFASGDSAELALESGDIDMISDSFGVIWEATPMLRANPDIIVGDNQYSTIVRICLNFRDEALEKYPWMADKKVRQALMYAIDRETLVQSMYNLTKAIHGPFASVMEIGQKPDMIDYSYDPEKAESLLDEAGYPRQADGYRFDNGELIGHDDYTTQIELICDMFDKVGIKAKPKPMDSTWINTVIEYSPEGLGSYCWMLDTEGTGPNPESLRDQYYSEALYPVGLNRGFFNDSETDRLLDKACGIITPYEERQEAWWDFVDRFQEMIPTIPLVDKCRCYYWHSYVRGVNEPPADMRVMGNLDYSHIWFAKIGPEVITEVPTTFYIGTVVAVIIAAVGGFVVGKKYPKK